MHNSKPINTPMKKWCALNLDGYPKIEEEINQMTNVLYVAVIGSLVYAMLCTRPDIWYAVVMVNLIKVILGKLIGE